MRDHCIAQGKNGEPCFNYKNSLSCFRCAMTLLPHLHMSTWMYERVKRQTMNNGNSSKGSKAGGKGGGKKGKGKGWEDTGNGQDRYHTQDWGKGGKGAKGAMKEELKELKGEITSLKASIRNAGTPMAPPPGKNSGASSVSMGSQGTNKDGPKREAPETAWVPLTRLMDLPTQIEWKQISLRPYKTMKKSRATRKQLGLLSEHEKKTGKDTTEEMIQDESGEDGIEEERTKKIALIQMLKDQNQSQTMIEMAEDELAALPAPVSGAKMWQVVARIETFLVEEEEEWKKADQMLEEKLEDAAKWMQQGREARENLKKEHELMKTMCQAKLANLRTNEGETNGAKPSETGTICANGLSKETMQQIFDQRIAQNPELASMRTHVDHLITDMLKHADNDNLKALKEAQEKEAEEQAAKKKDLEQAMEDFRKAKAKLVEEQKKLDAKERDVDERAAKIAKTEDKKEKS